MTFWKSVTDYRNPKSIASRIRKRRAFHIEKIVRSIFERRGRCRILDVGGSEEYWSIFDEEFFESYNISVTLLNLEELPVRSQIFTSVRGDGCALSDMGPDSFDLVHSNSVIEHVGDWDRMLSFAAEVKRVGGTYYVQTPNYWFPIEPHFGLPFFHWLPEPLRVSLQLRFDLGHMPQCDSLDTAVRSVQSIRLLDERMLRYLFPDSQIKKERIGFFVKSLIAIKQ